MIQRVDTIRSAADLEQAVIDFGFLPFFRCGVADFSVEDMTAWEKWFVKGEEGPWEWKGPVVREKHCAYGKLYSGKAGFVSLDWLPDLANYRRSKRYAKDDDTAALDDIVLQVVASEGSATIKELRRWLGFAGGHRHRGAFDLVDNAPEVGKVSLEPILARLMMGLRIVIADFEYNVDRHGMPYGWGIARYATPEALYGRQEAGRSPEESFERVFEHFRRILPDASEKKIRGLIG